MARSYEAALAAGDETARFCAELDDPQRTWEGAQALSLTADDLRALDEDVRARLAWVGAYTGPGNDRREAAGWLYRTFPWLVVEDAARIAAGQCEGSDW